MVAANVEAAKFVGRAKVPMLYRVHEPPPSEKLEGLEEFLRAHGIDVRWSEEPDPQQFAAIQKKAAGRPDENLVNAQLLRSLSLAVYQPENKGHFGLALEHYAHFTSPIRRYPDLLLHRAIKHLLRGGERGDFDYSPARMEELGRHCSFTERRAEDAARDVDERLKCQFMQRHVGDDFAGIISGVTSFGLFVELDELGVSGLVHITALPNDYYNFDPVSSSLTGKRRGRRYRLSDPVKVEVAGVNVEERKIDFRLVEGGSPGE
jgi:ribonuclease R